MKNTLIQTRIIFVLLILVLSFTFVINLRGYNETEAQICKRYIPNSETACKNNFDYKTLTCCFVKMKKPFVGDICMPMGMGAFGTKGQFDRILPGNKLIIGDYNCFGQYVKIESLTFYLFFIFILINIF
jgi:hypothetical protein